MSYFVSVIFCRRCSSRFVEISEWTSEGKAVIHCRSCGLKEEIAHFTLGRCHVSKSEHETARITKAMKNKYEK